MSGDSTNGYAVKQKMVLCIELVNIHSNKKVIWKLSTTIILKIYASIVNCIGALVNMSYGATVGASAAYSNLIKLNTYFLPLLKLLMNLDCLFFVVDI